MPLLNAQGSFWDEGFQWIICSLPLYYIYLIQSLCYRYLYLVIIISTNKIRFVRIPFWIYCVADVMDRDNRFSSLQKRCCIRWRMKYVYFVFHEFVRQPASIPQKI